MENLVLRRQFSNGKSSTAVHWQDSGSLQQPCSQLLRCPLNIHFCRGQRPGLGLGVLGSKITELEKLPYSQWIIMKILCTQVYSSSNFRWGISFYFLITCGIQVEFASKIKFSGSSEGECVIICTIH